MLSVAIYLLGTMKLFRSGIWGDVERVFTIQNENHLGESIKRSSLAALEKLSKAFRRPEIQIEKIVTSSCIDKNKEREKMSQVVPSRNRYGRPYISGRPLLTCDRQKIVECYKKGMKKIHIAKQLGITHSCVSKVLRRYAETGEIVAKACRTASCSCPGSAEEHDVRYCKHLQDNTIRLFFSIENILRTDSSNSRVIYFSKCPETSEPMETTTIDL
ncbi:hypothetical protein CRE_03332 [Caenorhabditis remanei]|uniref:Paired domain-containing protein n=1 Tax=Caenorhabditis remanei TaxID=31234 RepID=E3MYM7_CAERE|nr:hypothetical protein CRE_03332 [Caenorhabditis remanei]